MTLSQMTFNPLLLVFYLHMLKIDRSKLHFVIHFSLFFLINLKKSLLGAHQTFLVSMVQSSDFDVDNKERPGQTKKFECNELHVLLDINPKRVKNLQTSKELNQHLENYKRSQRKENGFQTKWLKMLMQIGLPSVSWAIRSSNT